MAKRKKNNSLYIFICGCIAAMAVASPVTNAPAQQYPPGMVSCWKFDEGSGAIIYDSVSGNHGTISGAIWTTGKFGETLSFDGINDRVTVPHNDSLNPQTIMYVSRSQVITTLIDLLF